MASESGSRPRLLRFALVAAVALAVAHGLDGWAFRHAAAPAVAERDWGRLLRVMGYFPTWVVLAVALALGERPGERGRAWFRSNPARLLWSVAVSGLLAEIVKLLVRRERPRLSDGSYVFRAFGDEPLRSAGLGFPSSHVAVAFGGAFALGWWHPRARWIGWGLAAGCAYTRIAAEAHFLSDVTGGALVGYLGAWAVHRMGTERRT